LFDILEVVCGVLVESYLANFTQRVLLVRPGEGVVEDVDAGGFCFLGVHDLKVYSVCRIFAAFNRVKEVLNVVIGVFTSKTECLIGVKVFDSSFGLDGPLDVYKSTILLAELVCVNTKSVDVTELKIVSKVLE
jgi:hypothetical protein